MKILNDQEFSLKLISESTETETSKSQILFNGKPIDSVVEGKICEACISYEEFFLVITSNDCPYEESLNIYFLSKNFIVLDRATLVWPYSTGSFVLLDLVQPNVIAFKFFDESTWKIELYPKKRIVIPILSEAAGVWRSFKLKHHFKVSKSID